MAELNLCDYHIHTRYSSDSTEEPENIIRHAIELGLDEICFTDHTITHREADYVVECIKKDVARLRELA